MARIRLRPLKGIRGVKGLDLPDRGRPATPLPVEGEAIRTLVDPEIQQVYARLGRGGTSDFRLAKRIVALRKEFPDGTIPELVAYDWLKQNGYDFTFQAWVYGGRSRKGGIVPDFVINKSGVGMVWMIQGNYWHSKVEISMSDRLEKSLLIGTIWEGMIITEVVELWENRIYDSRPQVFEWGIMGMEMPF